VANPVGKLYPISVVLSEAFRTMAPMPARKNTTTKADGGQLVGYARVSQAGCERIFRDVGSGTLRKRPQLDACLEYLRSGDTLVVWRLDRLGRSLRHLVDVIAALEQRHVAFHSLREAIDTTTANGRLQRARRVAARGPAACTCSPPLQSSSPS
jgi:hypothetical protein